MKGDQERALAAGCDAYLSKPIDTREFAELVASMLRAVQATCHTSPASQSAITIPSAAVSTSSSSTRASISSPM